MRRFLNINRAFFLVLVLLALSALLFISIGETVQDGTQQVVRVKREWVRQKNAFLKMPGKDTVIFLGNSRIAAGIVPELFDHQTKTTHSYNLALPALPLAPHYFLLNDFIKNNRAPKYIVMMISPGGFGQKLFPFYSIQGAGIGEILQYSFLRKDSTLLVNYFFPWRFYFPEMKDYLKGKVLSFMPRKIQEQVKEKYTAQEKMNETYPHNWSFIYDSNFVKPEETSQKRREALKENGGYYFIVEQAALGGSLPDNFLPKEKDRPKAENLVKQAKEDPFVDKFFKLTQKYGIKVVLISPYYVSDPSAINASNQALWDFLEKRYDNIYFINGGFKARQYAPRYFSDPIHVNKSGAIKYTEEIAQEFKTVLSSVK